MHQDKHKNNFSLWTSDVLKSHMDSGSDFNPLFEVPFICLVQKLYNDRFPRDNLDTMIQYSQGLQKFPFSFTKYDKMCSPRLKFWPILSCKIDKTW